MFMKRITPILHVFLSLELWCAQLYEHGGYDGWFEEVETGNNTLTENRVNGVSSVKVNSGCNFTGYTGIDFSGNLEMMTANTEQVSNNDQFSSYNCECDGR